MLKKLIALTLVILMVLPMIASCGEDEEKKPTSTGQGNVHDGEESISPEEKAEREAIMKYVGDLAEEHNFAGKTFTWIGGGAQAPEVAEETGDVAQDALYYRQRDIEDLFGITWVNYEPEVVEGGDAGTHPVVEAVRKDVMAGTKAYDAGYGTPVAVCQPLFLNSALANMSEYNGIDFSQNWWTASLLDTYHINGAVYFVNGAIVTSNYTDTHAILFNKDVAEEYHVGDLYSYVKDGIWTFDKMFQVASEVPTNENGAGAYRYSQPNGLSILYANNCPITLFNPDSTPYIPATYPKEISDLSDKFATVFGDNAQTVHLKNTFVNGKEDFAEKYDGATGTQEMFVDGKILFYFTITGDAADLREEDVEFGIIPLPKGSEEQENYISFAEPWSAFNVFVPKSTNDPDVTGVILEAMAALGRRYIKPAYYDNLLQSRSVYDNASREMIDIIFETKVYDIIDFIAVGGSNNEDSAIVKTLKGCIQETNEGITSKYNMQARIVNNHIQRTILPATEVGD